MSNTNETTVTLLKEQVKSLKDTTSLLEAKIVELEKPKQRPIEKGDFLIRVEKKQIISMLYADYQDSDEDWRAKCGTYLTIREDCSVITYRSPMGEWKPLNTNDTILSHSIGSPYAPITINDLQYCEKMEGY